MDIKNKNKPSLTFPLSHLLRSYRETILTGKQSKTMDIKNKNNLRVTFSPAHFLTCHAFTLIEILTVLVIIGIMVTGTAIAWQRVLGRVVEDVPVAAALGDMKAIKDAIVRSVYPDLGYIPCAAEDSVFTTSYLSFGYDQVEIDGVDAWNKYRSKGWRGPYIEPNSTLNATYFDPDLYPPDQDGNDISFGAIATPWAQKCEELAIQVKDQDPQLAKEYRKGKYYHILKPEQTRCVERDQFGTCIKYGWAISSGSACIVCRGENCLPGPAEKHVRTCTETCTETCDAEGTCKPKCEAICAGVDRSMRPACLKKCNVPCYEEVNKKCIAPCYSKCVRKLKIAEPDDPDYIDISDDVVMFVFRGSTRSPLDK